MCILGQFQHRGCGCLSDYPVPIRCSLAHESNRTCAEVDRRYVEGADENGECADCAEANRGRDMKEGVGADGFLSSKTFLDRLQQTHNKVHHMNITADEWTLIRAMVIDYYRTRQGATEKLHFEGFVTLMGFDVAPDQFERGNLLRIASERKRQCLRQRR